MTIHINSDWRIDSDSLQFILQHRRRTKKADAGVRWHNVGYFATLDSAILELARRRIRLLPGEYGPDALPVLCRALDEIKADNAHVLDKLGPGKRLTPETVKELMDADSAE